MRKAYQVGGGVNGEDDDFGVEGIGPLSEMDPATAMMYTMAEAFGRTTTPEQQRYSRDILDDLLSQQGEAPESAAIGAMRQQAEQVRLALRNARERLQAQEYNRGDLWLAASQALGAPTRTGALGETAANVFGALREPLQARRDWERERDDSLSELDLAEAQVEGPTTQAEFELEKLRETLRNRLQIEALENLGKSTGSLSSRLGQIIPRAAQAVDNAYAPEYLEWRSNGQPRAQQGLDTLRIAQEILESGQDTLSGPYAGALASIPGVGRWLQSFTSPEGANVRDLIEYVVQEQLRPILGSQFTREEGERLIARLYNVNLEERYNAPRLGAFIRQLESAFANKAAMAAYFRQYGTLYGFDGPTALTSDSFEFGDRPDPTDQLSEEARRSLLPGTMLLREEDEDPPPRARGGRVRYQQGGRVRFQEGGQNRIIFADPDEEEVVEDTQSGLDLARETAGAVPDMLLGTAGGLAAEKVLDNILRNIRGGIPTARVVGAFERAGMDPVAVANEVKRSQRLDVPQTLMDIDAPGVQALSSEAFEFGGPEAAKALRELRNRVRESRTRTQNRVNKSMKPEQYFQYEDDLMRRINVEGREKMGEVFAQHTALPVDPVMATILETPEGKKALRWAMRFYENAPGRKPGQMTLEGMIAKPSLEFYDYLRKGFDQSIANEEKGGATEYSEVLRNLRQSFVSRLDEMAPGYQEARIEVGDDLNIRDALRSGRNFMQLQPEQIEKLVTGMTFMQKDAYRTGAAQKLFEMMNRSSSANFNAASAIIDSPSMAQRLRPLFDSESEYNILVTALRKEAELFDAGRATVRQGANAQRRRERTRQTLPEYIAKTAPGFRLAISPLGWALRVMRDRPKMSQNEAQSILRILRSGKPEEMNQFIRRANTLRRLSRTRAPRVLGAAALGAAAGAGVAELRDGEE